MRCWEGREEGARTHSCSIMEQRVGLPKVHSSNCDGKPVILLLCCLFLEHTVSSYSSCDSCSRHAAAPATGHLASSQSGTQAFAPVLMKRHLLLWLPLLLCRRRLLREWLQACVQNEGLWRYHPRARRRDRPLRLPDDHGHVCLHLLLELYCPAKAVCRPCAGDGFETERPATAGAVCKAGVHACRAGSSSRQRHASPGAGIGSSRYSFAAPPGRMTSIPPMPLGMVWGVLEDHTGLPVLLHPYGWEAQG